MDNDNAALQGEWPTYDLESVPDCPACGSSSRKLLYDGIEDRVFFCAPGLWSIHACQICQCAFVDPRPTPQSISRAYGKYYTHGAPDVFWGISARPFKRLRDLCCYGYLNSRMGYRFPEAFPSFLSALYMAFSPRVRIGIERRVRHLKLPHLQASLLDVGCGNGTFLMEMRAAGWNVQGVEPDTEAVRAARSAGLDVREGMLVEGMFKENTFDAVTLSHVIEHLYDPQAALQICLRILKPGGTLWIATPNLHSVSHVIYKDNWMGLDPPRHLVVFPPAALADQLSRAGFRLAPYPYRRSLSAQQYFRGSEAIAHGDGLVNGEAPLSPMLRRQVEKANFGSYLWPHRSCELIVTAQKPSLTQRI